MINSLTKEIYKMYEEITVEIHWEGRVDQIDVGGLAEVMLHRNPKTGKILRAYTYKEDARYMPKKWLGEPSCNPLFVYLKPTFIRNRNHAEQIKEGISIHLENEGMEID